MTNTNTVYLAGELTRVHAANRVTFGAVKVTTDRERYVDFKCFDDAAVTLAGLEKGAQVKITAHLSADKPKDGSKTWLLCVVADKIEVVAEEGEF